VPGVGWTEDTVSMPTPRCTVSTGRAASGKPGTTRACPPVNAVDAPFADEDEDDIASAAYPHVSSTTSVSARATPAAARNRHVCPATHVLCHPRSRQRSVTLVGPRRRSSPISTRNSAGREQRKPPAHQQSRYTPPGPESTAAPHEKTAPDSVVPTESPALGLRHTRSACAGASWGRGLK
jgi:hypothetical protein